jgi:hypothetical protein
MDENEENFYYEDIVDGVKKLFTPNVLAIFKDAGISKQELKKNIEKNMVPVLGNENLDEYCKRYLKFLLLDQLNNNFAENIDKKVEKNNSEIEMYQEQDKQNDNYKATYSEAYENGDYKTLYAISVNYLVIYTLSNLGKFVEHKMNTNQVKVYEKYIEGYKENLEKEFESIHISQPIYTSKDVDEVEEVINTDEILASIDELDNEEKNNKANTKKKQKNKTNEIDTDSILASIDELETLDDDDYEEFENTEIDTDDILASIDDLDKEEPDIKETSDINEEQDKTLEESNELEFEDEDDTFDFSDFVDEDDVEETTTEDTELSSNETAEDAEISSDETAEADEDDDSLDFSTFIDEDDVEENTEDTELSSDETATDVEIEEVPEEVSETEGDDSLDFSTFIAEDDVEENSVEETTAEAEEDDDSLDISSFIDEDDVEENSAEENDAEDATAETEEDDSLDISSFIDEDDVDENSAEENEAEDKTAEAEEDDDSLDISSFIDEDNVEENEAKDTELSSDEISENVEIEEEMPEKIKEMPEETEVEEVEDDDSFDISNFVDEDEVEETTDEVEEEEIIDPRRNYDLNFEDNYVDIENISEEYLEARPEFQNSKFIEATGGTNLEDFISTMLHIRDTENTEVVGLFNEIPLNTNGLKTVDEIENIYDTVVDNINENEENVIKSKSDCISYDEYYNQFVQKDISRDSIQYRKLHPEISMILIPHNGATIEEFVDAALYFMQDDLSGLILSYDDIKVNAEEFATREKILEEFKQSKNSNNNDNEDKNDNKDNINNDDKNIEENTNNEDNANNEDNTNNEDNVNNEDNANKEVFTQSDEYYKSVVKISKQKTDEYRARHPKAKKAMVVVLRDPEKADDFWEAVRYYYSINKQILAQYNGILLVAGKYNSKEEMQEAYNERKNKKTE